MENPLILESETIVAEVRYFTCWIWFSVGQVRLFGRRGCKNSHSTN